MELRELEKVVRAAIRVSPGQPALATTAGSAELPAEYAAAAKSLADRTPDGTRGKSILAAVSWS